MDIGLIGRVIWIGIVAGLIGTAGMTLFLTIITKSGIAHADMVRAIGSMITKSLDNAFRIGMIVHFLWGIIFAVSYTIIFVLFNIHNVLYITVIGGLIGFVHGFAVSMMLVVAVAEYHPIEKFRKPGIEVAVAHFAAHLVYGVLVGLTAGLIGY